MRNLSRGTDAESTQCPRLLWSKNRAHSKKRFEPIDFKKKSFDLQTTANQIFRFTFSTFSFLVLPFFSAKSAFFFLLLTSFVFRNYSFSYCYYCSNLFSLNSKKF